VLNEDSDELLRWGPRPEEAQKKVMEYKALPEPRPPYEALSVEIQKWYNVDKGVSTQAELLGLFNSAS